MPRALLAVTFMSAVWLLLYNKLLFTGLHCPSGVVPSNVLARSGFALAECNINKVV